jgi:hypothetical protein
MREVYANAIVTIAAANSPSSQSGIFSPRVSGSARIPIPWKDAKHPTCHVYLRPGSELWDHSSKLSPLIGRGWTLQEGLLAPRTLSCEAQQMLWECPEFQIDEGGRTTQPSEDYRDKNFFQQLFQQERAKVPRSPPRTLLSHLSLRPTPRLNQWWKSHSSPGPFDKYYEILRQYAGRSLTKDTDILPALSGIARSFQNVLQSEYCAGMWKEDHIYSLLWGRSPRYLPSGEWRFDPKRPSKFLAPSWSWASILGRQVNFIFTMETRKALLKNRRSFDGAEVTSWSTVLEGSDPFGQVLSGELILRTRFCQLDDVPPTFSLKNEFPEDDPANDFPANNPSAFQEVIYNELLRSSDSVYEFYQQHIPHPGQHFGVIEIMRWTEAPGSGLPGVDFLMVESTGAKADEYRRIGQYRLRKPNNVLGGEVDPNAYDLLRDQAYDEITKRGKTKWKKRIVALV